MRKISIRYGGSFTILQPVPAHDFRSTEREAALYPVADDFASIAQRLKEIQAEVAEQRAAADARVQTEDELQSESRYMYGDASTCA